MKRFVLFCLVVIPFFLFSQTSKIDSLRNLLKDTEGIEKADIMLKIGYLLQFSDTIAAREIVEQALELSEKKNHLTGIADSWNHLGQIVYRQGDFKEAEQNYMKALEIFDALDHPRGKGKIYNNLALVYLNTGDMERAEEYSIQSLEIKNKLNDLNGISYTLSNLGLIFWNKREFSKAMDYLHQSLEIQEKIGDKNMISNTNNTIAMAYTNLNNFEKAIEYHLIGLRIAEEANNKLSMALGLNNLGIVYSKMEQIEESIQSHKKALILFLELDDKLHVAATNNNLGLAYQRLLDYDRSLEYHFLTLELRRELNDDSGILNSLANIGSVYENLNDYESAKKYYLESVELGEKLQSKWNLINGYNNLGRIYLRIGDLVLSEKFLLKANGFFDETDIDESYSQNLYTLAELSSKKNKNKEAYAYLLKYITVNDSLTSYTNIEKANELKIKYDLEEKLEENELLKKDLDLSNLHKRNLILTLVTVFIFLAAVIILFIIRLKNNKRLKLLNKELKISKNIAERHDEHLTLLNKMLRHDLTNILAVVLSAIKLYSKHPDSKLLKDAANKCKSGVSLINNLRKMEMKKSDVNQLKRVNLNKILDKLKIRFGLIEIDHTGNFSVLADDGLESVFQNIIENAVDHGGALKINVDLNEVSKFLEIRVVNNGSKIPDEIKDRIFEENFSHGDNAKTGMGLHLAECNIIRYGGSIYLDKNEDFEVSFILNLKKAE